MTEERAHAYAQALALGLGVTMYVVRSREGRFYPVQQVTDDCQVLATIAPPRQSRVGEVPARSE